jgi:quinol monooxygenase YgiN
MGGSIVALIVVTRLRLRDAQFLDEFFAAAVTVVEQATSADGNLAADVMAEANNTYWTRTSWQDEEAMRRFMVAEPHRSTMDRIDDWCDEATFVNWDQPDVALPDWEVAYGRLIAAGQVVNLRFASSDNAARSFPAISQPS